MGFRFAVKLQRSNEGYRTRFYSPWVFLPVAVSLLIVAASPTQANNNRRTPVVEVVENVRAAVVNIHSERTVQGPATAELFALAPSQNRINGMGTGVLIDPRGYIVTNQHVVEDVNVIRVRLADGTTHNANVLARDHEADLALLKIEVARPLPTIPLGTAQDLMVGETVIAIGNAYGYEHTVTVGVVSAIKRDVTLNKEVSYKSLIQTDASINPGNSGGPLLNINGEMIGVNVAIRAGAQGISFAIPVDTMMRVVADMISVRKRNGVWHGVIGHDQVGPEEPVAQVRASGEDAKLTNLAKTDMPVMKRELIVDRTEPRSPAGRAGLKAGDVLVKAGETRVGCSLDLERALLDLSAGSHVQLTIRRNGKQQPLDVVLEAVDRAAFTPPELIWRKLGLRLKTVQTELVSRTSQQLHGGLSVVEVNPGSVADKAGIQRGDILVGLHQWETLSPDNVVFVLTHPDLTNFNPLCFYIIRAGQVRRGWLQQVD